jgi:hypothetical protein
MSAQARPDTIRTRAGIGFSGDIVGLDAHGVVLQSPPAKRTIALDEIVKLEVDSYPDVAKAEAAFQAGTSRAVEADHLYSVLLVPQVPAWLRGFAAYRLFRIRLSNSHQLEALDAYLLLCNEYTEFAATLVWPEIAENDPARRGAMLEKVEAALRNLGGQRIAGQLILLRSALKVERKARPETPPVPPKQDQPNTSPSDVARDMPLSIPAFPPPSAEVRATFASLFGDRLSRVLGTPEHDDDVALAGDLVEASRAASDQLDLLPLLCEKAWQLGNKEPAGYASAMEAMRLLALRSPALEPACKERIRFTTRLIYKNGRGSQRVQAGKAIIEELLGMVEQEETADNLESAIKHAREALAIADDLLEPNRLRLKRLLGQLTNRQEMTAKAIDLVQRTQADPGNHTLREQLVLLYVVELDKPIHALQYAENIAEQPLRRLVILATKAPDELPEGAVMELADWYRGLADKASPRAKPAMLERARIYYSEFLKKHLANDLPHTKAQIALGQVDAELNRDFTRKHRFFGTESEDAARVVFVVDRSGSMGDSIDFVKFELKRSIYDLDQGQSFHIIFYSSGPPLEMAPAKLVPANQKNKQIAHAFIDSVIPQGETDPSKALERAFACKPDVICILTDGEFDKAIADLVKRANVDDRVTVHTVGFLYKSGEAMLKKIAQQNNGQYKFISETDLRTLQK